MRKRRAMARLLLGLAGAAMVAGLARAEDAGSLYQAMAIVTGTDMRSRPAGFAHCLREVLAKVSGEPRLLQDPRVAELAARADGFVRAFDYVDLMAKYKKKDDQGSYDRPHALTVQFDPARIDVALGELGERPWRGSRPIVVPVLSMRGPKTAYLLSADDPALSDQRGSFADRAEEVGMTARLPTLAELAAWGAVPGQTPPLPPAAGPDDAVVAGAIAFQETPPGWTGSWRMRWRGADYRWGVSGVNYDAAFRSIVDGVVRVASGHGTPD